ncbi:MAG: GPW/gp25 family protein [Desulfobacterales bacterium]|jgi:phage baseplate assembly protein W|nr:GPW/gp25 family protein [Desulfobacterales bacterium]
MATRDVRKIEPLMGRDLRLDYRQSGGFFEDADLATVQSLRSSTRERDLATIQGLANLEQAIANRLKTRQGELAALGHPGYGSRHHELIGQPNVERTRDLIKIYVLQALRDEPRIERVMGATVRAEHSPPRDTVRIELKLKVIGEQVPLNLVVPFSLEVMA